MSQQKKCSLQTKKLHLQSFINKIQKTNNTLRLIAHSISKLGCI